MELLCELNEQGTTIVIVTHDPSISLYGKRLVKLQDGKIISDEALKPSAEPAQRRSSS